jgi:hypothetical protein
MAMHLIGVYLMGVHLIGMRLIGMYLMGMHLKGVAKSVSDIMAALRILPAEAHPMDLRVGLPEAWRKL